MSVLREVLEAVDPALAEYAVADPGPDRFADVVADRGDLEAVAELSNLIAAAARAHAEGDPAAAVALWSDSARRLA